MLCMFHYYGVHRIPNALVSSYLYGKIQAARLQASCETKISPTSQILTDVPQGPILSPMLIGITTYLC